MSTDGFQAQRVGADRKAIAFLGLSVLFLAIGIAMVSSSGDWSRGFLTVPGLLVRIMGLGGVAFFGFGSVRFAWLLTKGGLTWGSEGFVDVTRLSIKVQIRYDEIHTVRFMPNSALGFGIDHPEHLPPWHRWLTRVSCRSMGLDALACSQIDHLIAVAALDRSQIDLFRADLQRFVFQDETVAEARRALAGADAIAAVRILEIDADSEHPEGEWLANRWRLLAEALAQLGVPSDEVEVVSAAADRPDDVELSMRLIDVLRNQKLNGLLAAAMEHVASVDGQQDHLFALMKTYENAADYVNARRAFETMKYEYPDELAGYFGILYSILTGDVSAAEEKEAAFTSYKGPQDPIVRTQLTRVHDMLVRAQTVREASPLDASDLRGWHYVITGAVLLHLSPFGWETMRGRWAYVADTYLRCRRSLERLGRLLELWGMPQDTVLVVDEPASTALAEAASRLLGMNLTDYAEDLEGLVTVYDLDNLDEKLYPSLAEHRPGQILYAHTSRWTNSTSGYAADVTGHLHQVNSPPWDEQIRVVGLNRVEKTASHPGPPSVWAEYIVAGGLPADVDEPSVEVPLELVGSTRQSPNVDDHDIDSPEPLWQLARQVVGQAAAFQMEGARNRFWTGGPVRSVQFGQEL